MSRDGRPACEDVDTAADVRDWYWTRAELDNVARRLGLSRRGSKADVTARLIAQLAGEDPAPPPVRPRPVAGLSTPLTPDMVVPDGQRMTRGLRDWFIDQVGSGFRFDSHMRGFFADPRGRTLSDAVRLWHDTRSAPPPPIGAQFEYNRFTRWYRATHPQADRADLMAAWRVYKDTPAPRRPPLPD